jgi:signal transduction histidine kinase
MREFNMNEVRDIIDKSNATIREVSRELGAAEYRRDRYREALERIIQNPRRAVSIATEAIETADGVEQFPRS